MSEIAGISRRFLEEQASGRPAALATLVRTRGSSYRRAGARALVLADGSLYGGISGGCLEQDVALRARDVLQSGEPALFHYDTGADDDRLFGLNIGCGGQLDVMVEQVHGRAAEQLGQLEKLERERRRAILATVLAPAALLGRHLLVGADGEVLHSTVGDAAVEAVALEAAMLEASRAALARPAGSPWMTLPEPQAELFLERIAPPQALILFGSGFDVEPLVFFGRALGFEVVVADVRGSEAALERFAAEGRTVAARGAAAAVEELAGLLDQHAAVLVMNHHYDHDRDLVRELLRTRTGYIGLLGPQSRGRRLLGELKGEVGTLDTARVYSPVGLDLGADTPEKVALSILAEILAVLAGRQGGFLKDRATPIHAP